MANRKKTTKNKNNVTTAQDRRKTGPTPSRGNRRAVGAVTQRIEAARALTETITSIANRIPVPDSTPVAAGELHMTVATGANAAHSLDREARLVTAALMYADRVTLVSPGAHLLDGVASMDDWPAEQIVELLLRIGPYLRDPSFVRLLQAPRRQLVALVESPNGQVMLQGLRDVVAELTSTPGILALTQAREAGVLEVQRLVPRPQDEPYLDAVREHLSLRPTTDASSSTPEILVSRLAGLLSGGRSLPVLDDGMGSMARSCLDEGIFVPATSAHRRAAQGTTATGFIERLPAFDGAAMDEVLDLRADLAPTLSRFRGEVVRLSGEIAEHALDDDFSAYVDEQWVGTVAPAMQEIREGMADSGFGAQLREQLVSKRVIEGAVGGSSGGWLGVALGNVSLSAFAVAVASMGIGATFDAWKEGHTLRSQTEHNGFWFLYEANERLGG